MEYYSAIKKNKRMPFIATWMQLEIIIHKCSKPKKKDKYHMISPTGDTYDIIYLGLQV